MKLKKEKTVGVATYALFMGIFSGMFVIMDILAICAPSYVDEPKVLQVLNALALSSVSLCFLYYAILLAACGIISLLSKMGEKE